MHEREINAAALKAFPAIAKRWLPNGKLVGRKWVAKNPNNQRSPTSNIKIELATGRWDDFDTGDHGHGAISLAVFLFNVSPAEAAHGLSNMLGTR